MYQYASFYFETIGMAIASILYLPIFINIIFQVNFFIINKKFQRKLLNNYEKNSKNFKILFQAFLNTLYCALYVLLWHIIVMLILFFCNLKNKKKNF